MVECESCSSYCNFVLVLNRRVFQSQQLVLEPSSVSREFFLRISLFLGRNLSPKHFLGTPLERPRFKDSDGFFQPPEELQISGRRTAEEMTSAA